MEKTAPSGRLAYCCGDWKTHAKPSAGMARCHPGCVETKPKALLEAGTLKRYGGEGGEEVELGIWR